MAGEERFEGLHDDLVRLVRGELSGALDQARTAQVLALLGSPTGSVQELGGELLATHADPAELTMRQIAELGSHEIRSVREAAWAIYDADKPRVLAELEEALRILDARWDDTRAWAFAWFESHLTSDALTPALLVSMCDGVRPDVQAFGRRMLQLHFESEHGPTYLLHLSQHPAEDMQLFATNYLERYASEQPERVERLAPYFASVLSRVNKGRVAKARVHAFLAAEAEREESSARVIAAVLAQVSATVRRGRPGPRDSDPARHRPALARHRRAVDGGRAPASGVPCSLSTATSAALRRTPPPRARACPLPRIPAESRRSSRAGWATSCPSGRASVRCTTW